MTNSDQQQRIRENYLQVSDQVAQAAMRCHRQSGEVQIIGVTKYVDAQATADLVKAGCLSLGESRPQVMWKKAGSTELAGKPIEWHMIGHVQRNKLRRILRLRPMIHSVDSERLLHAIGQEATALGDTISVLLEVNISGDESKTGLSATAIGNILQTDPQPLVRIMGLMAMAGMRSDASTARKQFASVRQLRDQLAASSGNPLTELSMGMSGDFSEAIAEGATMVRIGSRLFSGVL